MMQESTVLKELDEKGFYRIPFSINEDLIDQTHDALRALFALPLEVKKSYISDTPVSPGYTPYGDEKAADTGIPNLLEAWEISTKSPIKWPVEVRAHWRTLVELENTLINVGHSFLKELENELALPKASLTSLFDSNESVARYINYPAHLAKNNQSGGKRQSLHADMSIITLNIHATSQGLLADDNGSLVEVNPKKHEVVVMPGSILEYVTGGRIKACKHTVATPTNLDEANDRISMPFFMMPNDEKVLQVLKEVAVEQIYDTPETVKAGEFIEKFYDKVFKKKQLTPK